VITNLKTLQEFLINSVVPQWKKDSVSSKGQKMLWKQQFKRIWILILDQGLTKLQNMVKRSGPLVLAPWANPSHLKVSLTMVFLDLVHITQKLKILSLHSRFARTLKLMKAVRDQIPLQSVPSSTIQQDHKRDSLELECVEPFVRRTKRSSTYLVLIAINFLAISTSATPTFKRIVIEESFPNSLLELRLCLRIQTRTCLALEPMKLTSTLWIKRTFHTGLERMCAKI